VCTDEECQYRGSHIPSGGPAVSIRVINFVWELGKWRINELAGGIMCAGTEKGVRERNLWASGKSQLSGRRTPRAPHSWDARRCPRSVAAPRRYYIRSARVYGRRSPIRPQKNRRRSRTTAGVVGVSGRGRVKGRGGRQRQIAWEGERERERKLVREEKGEQKIVLFGGGEWWLRRRPI